MAWQDALVTVLRRVNDPLTRQRQAWLLTGSAALALHGLAVQPRDIDMVAQTHEGVDLFRLALLEYEQPGGVGVVSLEAPLPDWRSSRARPIAQWREPNGSLYWLGRWDINAITVELYCNYVPDTIGKLAISFGDQVWSHLKLVNFDGYNVPLAPLELQLADYARRGKLTRVREIVSWLKQHGFERELLEQALRDEPSNESAFKEIQAALGISA